MAIGAVPPRAPKEGEWLTGTGSPPMYGPGNMLQPKAEDVDAAIF